MQRRLFASWGFSPFISSVVTLVFLASCAGGMFMDGTTPPEWAETPLEDTDTEYAFRGDGSGENLPMAKTAAFEDLMDSIIKSFDLGEPELWAPDGRSAVRVFRQTLDRYLRSPDTVVPPEGFTLVRSAAWSGADSPRYVLDILWGKDALDEKAMELANRTGVSSPRFRDLKQRALTAENDGNIYEAALIWAAAAGTAEEEGNLAGFREALRQARRILDELEFELIGGPGEVYVGTRPDESFRFQVTSAGKPIGNGEFLVTYPRAARDGSPSVGYARVPSNEQGVVRFVHPEIPHTGSLRLSLAPSSEPFLEYLSGDISPQVESFIDAVEDPRIFADFEGLARLRDLATGIMILETDLAGNSLNSSAAADGLVDDLILDGFDVEVMDLDPREMISRSERALLRDLKADSRFSSVYDRVIHGTVSLESFEQDGESFTVRVSGTLAYSDIPRQVVRYRLEITKTSRAGDSQQAISAAFRQLGRSFAAELIAQAPQ